MNMLDLEYLKQLRDKEEITKYFKKNNIKISDTEIERLKNIYKSKESQASILNLQQLDKVIGGVTYQRALFSTKYKPVKGIENELGISFYKHRIFGINFGLVKLTKENINNSLKKICVDYIDDSRMNNTINELNDVDNFIKRNYDTSEIYGNIEVENIDSSGNIFVKCGNNLKNNVVIKLGEKYKNYKVEEVQLENTTHKYYIIDGEPGLLSSIKTGNEPEIKVQMLTDPKDQKVERGQHIKFPNGGHITVIFGDLEVINNSQGTRNKLIIENTPLAYNYIMNQLNDNYSDKTHESRWNIGRLSFYIQGKNSAGSLSDGFMIAYVPPEKK